MTNPLIPKPLLRAFRELQRAFSGVLGGDLEERAASMSSIYEQVWTLLDNRDVWAYLMDIFHDDTGALFAVVASEGKLYRVNLTISEGTVTVGDWVEVVQEFVPVGRQLKIVRGADGKYRGFLISSTAVLNRVGEIDTTLLHQNMNRRASESGAYPYVDLFHLGPEWRIGETDLLGLDEFTAVASFTFDDTPLARAMIACYQDDPAFWGASISFYPLEHELIQVGDIEIPAYTDGQYEAITILPEQAAASLYTALRAKEVKPRMNQALLDMLKKLGEKDPTVQNQVDEFIGMVDDTNREIRERNLVRRDGQGEDTTPAEASASAPGAIAEAQPPTAVEPEEEEEPAAVELDEESVTAIAAAAVNLPAFADLLRPLQEAINNLVTSVQSLQSNVETVRSAQTEAETRLRSLEATDDEKQRTWSADIARRTKRNLNVTYRPSAKETPGAGPTSAGGKAGFEEIAAGTIANLKK